ncbi:MAG: MotE family protein, partial [Thermodesulfobacteriota bacterium]
MTGIRTALKRFFHPEAALTAGLAAKAAALVFLAGWVLWLGLAERPAGPAPAMAQEGAQTAAEKPAAESAPPADQAAAPAAPADPSQAAPAGPTQFDPRLIQLIEQKRADLAAKEALLARERQEIEKLKAEVVNRIDELKKVQLALEELIKAEQDKRSERIEQIVKLLGNMRPDAAGAVVSRLDDQMAVEVFSRMQPRIAGKVMAAIDPARAARISELITRQKQAREAAAMAQQAAAPGAPRPAQPPAAPPAGR